MVNKPRQPQYLCVNHAIVSLQTEMNSTSLENTSSGPEQLLIFLPEVQVTFLVLYGIVSLLGTVGNIFIVVTVVRYHRHARADSRNNTFITSILTMFLIFGNTKSSSTFFPRISYYLQVCVILIYDNDAAQTDTVHTVSTNRKYYQCFVIEKNNSLLSCDQEPSPAHGHVAVRGEHGS